MTSTYAQNSGITLMGTGDQNGTWGDTTNLNLQIIDRLTNGVGAIALSGTTYTLTTADGTLNEGQYKVLVFGGSPSGTNTVTVSPNTRQHFYVVKNSSGQSVIMTQGSGGNVTIANGASKIVYCDGAGATAAVVDVTSTLSMSNVTITGGAISGASVSTASASITGGTITGITDLAVADGGTGASDAATARTNLGAAASASPAFTGQASFADGSASAPSIAHTGDLNAGIFFPAADTVAVATSGTEAMRIDSSGSVGIGRTPTSVLDIYKATTAQLFVRGDAGVGVFSSRSSTDAQGPNFTLRKARGTTASQTAVVSGDTMGTLNFSAYGGTSDRAIASITGAVGTYTSDTDISSFLYFSTAPTGSITPAERMRIGSAGEIGIGGANYGTSGQVLTSGGSGAAPSWANAQATNVQTFTSSGTWTKPAGAKLIYLRLWGAGGGGGSGKVTAAGSANVGGGGGGGGAVLECFIPAADVGSTVSVIVGAGGTGGAAAGTAAANGNNGIGGGVSIFVGYKSNVSGGGGGLGGNLTTTAGGTGGNYITTNEVIGIYQIGGYGGNAVIGSAGSTGDTSNDLYASGAGGGGGGDTSANAANVGGAGGGNTARGTSGGAGGATAGAAGGAGGAYAGGGGGASSISSAGGAGGAGGLVGGGGGGGGGARVGFLSGAGGAGANGYVEIYTW